jgi:hypothetical protein
MSAAARLFMDHGTDLLVMRVNNRLNKLESSTD